MEDRHNGTDRDGDDALLVHRARAGDVTAFGRLVRMHRDAALGVAFAIVGSIDDAEDVAQEAFLIAHAKLVQLRDPAQFRSWLLTIVRRTALGWLARWAARRMGTIDGAGIATCDLRRYPGAERTSELAGAVGDLPPIYRDAVLLHYGADLSYEEIADLLDLPVTTVKGRLQQSRIRLRERLGRPGRRRIPTQGSAMNEKFHEFAHHPETGRVALRWFAWWKHDRTGIDIYELATSKRIAQITQPDRVQRPVFSPDGTRILFSAQGTNAAQSLYTYSLADATTTPVVDRNDGTSASFGAWSSDGRRIAYNLFAPADTMTIRRELHICITDLSSGESRQVTGDERTSPLDADRFPRWSPDGDHIAFLRTIHREKDAPQAAGIIDLGPSGDPVTRFAPRREGVGQLLTRACWSPDGRRLVYTEESGRLPTVVVWNLTGETLDLTSRVVVIDTETLDVVWTADAADIRGAGFSTDGAHVWCVTRKEILWMDVATGAVLDRLVLATALGEHVQVADELEGSAATATANEVMFLTTESELRRWRIGYDVDKLVDSPSETTDTGPPIHGRDFTKADYDFPLPDGGTLHVSHAIPPSPKRPVILSAENGYSTVEWLLIEEGYEWIIPQWKEVDDMDLGVRDVDYVVRAGHDWVSRHPDCPLIALGFGYEGLIVLRALAAEKCPFAAGIASSPCLKVSDYRPFHWGSGSGKSVAELESIVRERSPLAVADRIRAPLLIIGPSVHRTPAEAEEYAKIAEIVRSNGVRCDLVNRDERDRGHYVDRHIRAFLDEFAAT